MNPLAKPFCLQNANDAVLIPIVFNNTRPAQITYSISPLSNEGSKAVVHLGGRDLKQIEKARSDALTALENAEPEEEDLDDDYYENTDSGKQLPLIVRSAANSEYGLERTEVLQHIKVTKPGIVRLERALDQSNADVRLRPTEVTVVYCPKVEFVVNENVEGRRCVGMGETLDLKVYGVTPLTLKWHREVSGRRENFLVEGIEGAVGALFWIKSFFFLRHYYRNLKEACKQKNSVFHFTSNLMHSVLTPTLWMPSQTALEIPSISTLFLHPHEPELPNPSQSFAAVP